MRRTVALVLLSLIRIYQLTLGRVVGGNCRFHPTCSDYADRAIRLNGALVGGAQAVGRIVRCGPWSKGGVDHPRPVARAARRMAGDRG